MVAASARASSRESRIRARGFRVRAVGRGASVARSMPETPAPGRYRIAIHRAMGCYFAAVDDLPGCFARGASEVEAVENAPPAIRTWLHAGEERAQGAVAVALEIVS